MNCDICSAPGTGTLISAEQMREAVFANGFNPFELGLSYRSRPASAYVHWKTTIVAPDTSDWNICSRCMAKLQPYLEGAPKPAGVRYNIGPMRAIEQELKRAAEPEAPAKKDLSFRCEGCGQSYTLGKDALVATSSGVMADFQAVTVLGDDSTFVGSRAHPDLVDSLERTWSSLETSVARGQQDEISRVSLSLSKGRTRWWKCRKCGTVQTYELIPMPSKQLEQFERKTVEEAKAAAIPAIPKQRIADGKTNGLAIASLILGIVSVPTVAFGCGGVLAIAAFITGLIARRQVKESDGVQGGAGVALAGTILGGVIALLACVIIVVLVLEGS